MDLLGSFPIILVMILCQSPSSATLSLPDETTVPQIPASNLGTNYSPQPASTEKDHVTVGMITNSVENTTNADTNDQDDQGLEEIIRKKRAIATGTRSKIIVRFHL